MKALIIGSTGLVGSHLLEIIKKDPELDEVDLLLRKKIDTHHPKIKEHVIDFNQLEKHSDLFSVDVVFSCVGTTIKIAGSQENFISVDYKIPVTAAKLSKQMNVKHFIHVSALGADENSKVFYNKVKGECERDCIAFGPKKVTAIRPSLIMGEREESRPAEYLGQLVMKVLNPIMLGPLKKYSGSDVNDIAKKCIEVFKSKCSEKFVYID